MDKPRVLQDECVRRLSKMVQCDACISACPEGAVYLRKGERGVSVGDSCSGCNLCSTVCPSEAVRPSGGSLWDRQGELAVICERAGETETEMWNRHWLKPGCITALDLRFLLAGWASGLRRIVVYGADCFRCEVRGPWIPERGLARTNRILAEAGKKPLEVVCRRSPPFENREEKPGAAFPFHTGMSRRGFLKDLAASTMDTASPLLTPRRKGEQQDRGPRKKNATGFLRALGLLSDGNAKRREGRFAAYRVQVSPVACYGCGVCASLCPTGALSRHVDEASPCSARMEIDASRCHGCNACRDLCDVGAIRIEFAPGFHDPESVSFFEQTCQACGRTFLSPSATSHHCPGCRKRDREPSFSGPVPFG